MHRTAKSFLRLFAAMAAVAVTLSAWPTYIDLDRNQRGEFCVWIGGNP